MVNVVKASERRIERDKERIIRAALELFRVHGIRKVTINADDLLENGKDGI